MADRFTGTRRGRMSAEEDAVVIATAHRPLSLVAQKLDRHPSTVHWARVRLGVKAPVERQFRYLRNGRAVKSYSAEEDRFIEALRSNGSSLPEIACRASERFGHPRTAAGVRVRLIQLANREFPDV